MEQSDPPTIASGDAPTAADLTAAGLAARSDRTLIELVRSGRDDAATALYARYASRLRSLAGNQLSKTLAAKVEPEDIVQSVFRSFFRRAAHGLYDVPRHEELWGLLLVSALNKIRAQGGYHNAAKRDARKTISVEDVPESAASSDDAVALADLRIAIEEVLARLPASARPIVERRIAGEEVEEVARHVARSKRSVERVLQEFRRELMTAIGLDRGDPAPPQES